MRKFHQGLLYLLLILPQMGLAALNMEAVPEKVRGDISAKFPEVLTDTFSPYQADNVLRYLMSKGMFQWASIDIPNENEPQNLVLSVQFLKTIRALSLEGEDEVEDNEIYSVLQVSPGDRFETALIQDMQNRIRSLYAERGFHQVKIDILLTLNPDQSVNLKLKIQEGPPLRIGSLTIRSDNKELEKKMTREVRSFIGKILTRESLTQVNNRLAEYLREHRYIRAEIPAPEIEENSSKSKASVVFNVIKAEQYSVQFEGNYNQTTPALTNALDLENFYSANPNVGSELVKKIKDHYLQRGYARVEVESEELDFKRGTSAKIKFKIKEGPLVRIKEIEISGETSKKPEDIIDFLIENADPIIQKKFYHRELFETSLKNYIVDLQNQGYLKARINSTRYQYDKKKENVTIYLDLDEGPLTIITEILLEGNTQVPSTDLLKTLNLRANTPLKLNDLEQGLRNLKIYYQEQGFLEMKLLNEMDSNLVNYSEDNSQATLKIRVQEGPKVKVNSIIVDGNSITKEFVIRKELDFEEGQFLSPSRISESIRRLQKTGLFSSIEIRTLEENTQIANRTVIVKVSDRNPGLFNVGAGFTNEREVTLRGFIGLAYRNIDGLAKALSGRLDVNYNVTDLKYPEFKITFGYLEPYLLNTRTKGRINVTRSVLVTDYEKRQATDTQNATFSLEQNLTSHTLLSYDLWGINTIKDFPIDEDSTVGFKVQNIGTTGPGIEIDFRDHPFNPTHGSLTRLNVEFSHPEIGSSRGIEYLKTTGSFSYYFPLGKSHWVLANQLRAGTLENQSDLASGGVPYSKKGFTLGGISTIRGFEAGTSERFPNDQDLGSDDFYLKTRANFTLIKSELRFPIYGSIAGALFYDGGMVNIDGLDFQDNYRDSAGLGVRYLTPVGPVSLELAWKLDRKKERRESPYRFHFSIGSF